MKTKFETIRQLAKPFPDMIVVDGDTLRHFSRSGVTSIPIDLRDTKKDT